MGGVNIQNPIIQKLDELDIAIIKEFQQNGIIHYKELSNRLGVAQSTVYDRVRRLKEEKVILEILPLLDANKCGLPITAWIRISIRNIQDIDRISKELAKIDEILEVFEISGKWDILVKTKVENNEELRNLEVYKIGLIEGIIGLYSIIAIRTEKEDIRLSFK